MVFASFSFLYYFLPLSLALYYAARRTVTRNIILIVLSLFFYAWGEPVYVTLLIFSSAVDYCIGRIIDANFGHKKAKLALIASLFINLSLLGFFKYSGFFVENINTLLGLNIPVPNIGLPIGISFYTFQTMSYSIDMYRGKATVQRSFTNFLLFVSLFPQLIAGPIVRYTDIAEQLGKRKHSLPKFCEGISRFLTGLAKKTLIANHAGLTASGILDNVTVNTGGILVWLGILMYTIQIYFDFSGYSDMAIGLGKMFGFEYVENFNYPYISKTITEFWRRWHISLSSFFKDYVYIPLGGNRRLQIRNIFIVWGLTGLWHGASWNFVFWGLYYALILAAEKLFLLKLGEKLPSALKHLFTLAAVMIGWTIFYYTDLSKLGTAFCVMAGTSGFFSGEWAKALTENLPFLVVAAICSTPALKVLYSKIDFDGHSLKLGPRYFATLALTLCVNTALLMLCTAKLSGDSFNPFIYFRF